MPANIEIKCVLKRRGAALATAARVSGAQPDIIHQEDVFFRCGNGRLKLRIFAADHQEPERGELIHYERDDIAEVRCSRYSIARTPEPRILLDILTKTLGVVGTVRKTRTLYMAGQTRIHIDQVDRLGDFLELEVVLSKDQSEEDGKRVAYRLLSEFEIEPPDLVAGAYIDLLAGRTA